jgi:uncharacterized repeat protein (TIGR04138 family)
MSEMLHPVLQLLRDDPRFRLEAYQLVSEALSYAQDVLGLGERQRAESDVDPFEPESEQRVERHLTGQQLCEAIRVYALEQYGYMARVVLNSWGIRSTGDFGEIVYNLIRIGRMKKSPEDRREDFDDVFDFDLAFQHQFEITLPD